MVVSGELSMTSVFDAVVRGRRAAAAWRLGRRARADSGREQADRRDGDEPFGAQMVDTHFYLSCAVPNIPPGMGSSDLARNVPTPFAPGIDGRSCDVQPPARGGTGRRDLQERRRLRAAPLDRERAARAERAANLGGRAGTGADGPVPIQNFALWSVAQCAAEVVGVRRGAHEQLGVRMRGLLRHVLGRARAPRSARRT